MASSSKPPTEDNCTNQPPPIIDSNCTSHFAISVAIDFGTTNCAVAYSHSTNKEKVIVINDWQDGIETHGKIPTAILFDKNQRFLAFGNGAIEQYKELMADEKHDECYLFKNCKMELYNRKDLTEKMTILDETGKQMKALDVLTAAIKYMRQFLLELLIRRGAERKLADNEITWVITVPAIWNNAAKQIMRKAAEKAGCLHWATHIALEPEAASIYCQNQPNVYFEELLKKDKTKYLVVDIGGGTLDITAHEILGLDHIKEVHRVSGNDLGGVKVDQLFVQHLKSLFGEENIAKIQTENLDEWLRIMEDFKISKKKVTSKSSQSKVFLKSTNACPWDQNYFNNVSDALKEGAELKKNGNLVIDTTVIGKMIATVTSQIAEYVSEILKEIDGLDAILLVGGFANSPIVIEEMKNLTRERIRLIVPENSELCVVKGAVVFGWKRDIIRSRKSRYTYGFSIRTDFIEGKHDESRSEYDLKGQKECKQVFRKLVTIDDDLPLNKCVEFVSYHPHTESSSTFSRLYRSKDTDPKYCDVKGVDLVGEIEIPKPVESRDKRIIKHIYFGDTEIYLKLTDETSGETYEKRFDFLTNRDMKLVE